MIRTKVLEKKCDGESKAFFVKMVGDYYRYIAENAKGNLLEQVKQDALEAYMMLTRSFAWTPGF